MSTDTMVQVSAAKLAKLEAMEAKQKLSGRRAAVKILLMVEKARAAKITVTKEEIAAKMAEQDAKNASVAAQPAEEE